MRWTLLLLATPLLGCTFFPNSRQTLSLPAAQATEDERLAAFYALRPVAATEAYVEDDEGNSVPTGIFKEMKLGNGQTVSHPADLRVLVPPGSPTARKISEAEAHAAAYKKFGRRGWASLGLLMGSMIVAGVTTNPDEPPSVVSGVALTASLAALVAGSVYGVKAAYRAGQANQARSDAFVGYEYDLAASLGICATGEQIHDCARSAEFAAVEAGDALSAEAIQQEKVARCRETTADDGSLVLVPGEEATPKDDCAQILAAEDEAIFRGCLALEMAGKSPSRECGVILRDPRFQSLRP